MLNRLIRYGTIGAGAAAVYFALAIALVEGAALAPLSANATAFVAAFAANYTGQRLFTFPDSTRAHRTSAPRFLVVALVGFTLNQGLLFLLLEHAAVRYLIALPLAAAGATSVTFLLSLVWAFGVHRVTAA